MKVVRSLAIVLVFLGICTQAFAGWTAQVYNKTPYGIMVKVKSWKGLLNGGWVTIPAGETRKAGPGGADCIDGMWVKVNIPSQGYIDLGYFNFTFKPMSPCSNTTAVVGVEPVVTSEATHGISTTGTIGMTKTVLKQFKFYVGHIHGDVDSAPAATDINF